MFKRIFTICWIMYLAMGVLYGQKPVIDSSVFGKWPTAEQPDISSDGKYLVYSDATQLHQQGLSAVAIETTDKKHRLLVRNVRSYKMLQDKRQVVFQTGGDSLFVLELGRRRWAYLGKGKRYDIMGEAGREWVCYATPANMEGQVTLTIWGTGERKQRLIDSVEEYWFNDWYGGRGDVVVVKKRKMKGRRVDYQWEWHDMDNGRVGTIWEGSEMGRHRMDRAGKQLCFFTKEEGNKFGLWYYREGMERAELQRIEGAPGIDSSLQLDDRDGLFSLDGKKLIFLLVDKKFPHPSAGGVQVDVWSYRDPFLEEAQLRSARSQRKYYGYIDIAMGKAYQLEQDDLHIYGDLGQMLGNVLMYNYKGDDEWWRGKERAFVYLKSFANENRMGRTDRYPAVKWVDSGGMFILSPGDRYVLDLDLFKGSVSIYEVANGRTTHLSEDPRWTSEIVKGEPFSFVGWLPEDSAFLACDKWDIWRVDPKGARAPENLTGGYGRRHHIQFRLVDGPGADNIIHLPEHGELLLKAFDTVTKYSGYYRLHAGKLKEPVQLTMGPYWYVSVTKARDANAWLVRRESAEESSNYYFTSDWVYFRAVTDVRPEKQYNWLKAELTTWLLPDGQPCQGMLFKPENLDEHKKYPLILYYYEASSDELYQYREPGAAIDAINIPYFVSRGYVVFVPDIHYQKGHAGECALASIVSGARYVARRPWIDSTRMGLQGSSFGGYETNYVITHSNLFAAAEESAGVSDMLSFYNSLVHGGAANQAVFEVGQLRMGASFWENPSIYMEGSPILRADKVVTPLLMMHNKRDETVTWTQGVEFFSALRRCGKKVWMLQYDSGGHCLQPDRDALDYTIRMEQFFNYYLKGTPPPRWMTEGVSARKKGACCVYELDTSGAPL